MLELLPQTYPHLVDWIQQNRFGSGKAVVREIKFIDINMKCCDAPKWDALFAKNFGDGYSPNLSIPRHDLPSWKINLFRKVMEIIGPLKPHNIKIDPSLVEQMPCDFKRQNSDWAYWYPLGRLDDNLNTRGLELL
jgi:hypothetical protein